MAVNLSNVNFTVMIELVDATTQLDDAQTRTSPGYGAAAARRASELIPHLRRRHDGLIRIARALDIPTAAYERP